MKMLDIRRYEMLVRVKEFGVAHVDLFPAPTVGGRLFGAVNASVDAITVHGAVQSHQPTARDRASIKAAARETLRESLQKIARTARAVAAETPLADGTFVVPKSRSDRRLLLAARAFVQDATPFRDQFVAHQLPATFLDDTLSQIDAFERAIQQHVTGTESRAAARAGIADAFVSGMAAVERLDAIVANALEHQPEMLAEWDSARHVSRVSVPYPGPKNTPSPPARATTKAA